MTATLESPAEFELIAVYPENDRCSFCGIEKAEHDYSEIHKDKLETYKICYGCLHAEDGSSDVNDDLPAEERESAYGPDWDAIGKYRDMDELQEVA